MEVLDSIDWTADRQLHVVGVSMGGMIAQELVKASFHWGRNCETQARDRHGEFTLTRT